jgi:hypothetical protein
MGGWLGDYTEVVMVQKGDELAIQDISPVAC